MILSWSHQGATGVVESAVFQPSVDYPNDLAAGYHVVLDDGRAVTVRWDQLGPLTPATRIARAIPDHSGQ